MTFTTVQNAFGTTGGYFHEGKLEHFRLFPGDILSHRVEKIKQIELLPSKCSKTSYYECLEEALANLDNCTFGGTQGGVCEYLTMPNSLLPVCNSPAARQCSKDAFWKLFNQKDHHCRKTRTCSMQQYLSKSQLYQDQDDNIAFQYTIDSPQSSEGVRMQDPYKVLHMEYLIINELALIANIAGTLGLTIGFSFSGTIQWLTDVLPNVWKRSSDQTELVRLASKDQVCLPILLITCQKTH